MSGLISAVPVLVALDVPRTKSFWVDVLGFEEDFEVEDFAGISRDDVEIFICSVDDQLVPDNTQAWVRCANLDSLHAEWAAHLSLDYSDVSGPAMTQIREVPWGREFGLRDPGGNLVHFMDALDDHDATDGDQAHVVG